MAEFLSLSYSPLRAPVTIVQLNQIPAVGEASLVNNIPLYISKKNIEKSSHYLLDLS